MVRAAEVTVKPPYAVPSMADIQGLQPNGFSAVSTFSGCGGSSLGYRMAGFKMLWASEFVPAARETYRANASADTVLDERDIRGVTAVQLLEGAGLSKGEVDLFDGSPPCASFSTAGKREAGWGRVKKYSDTEQRTDDLFFEYARLIDGVQPRVFVAENVSGLLRGTAKGYFKLVLGALRDCGYNVQARLLDASWLGVPQARRRVIFIGVRNDLGMSPVYPRPLPYQYTVRDALPWILEQGDAGGFGGGAMRPAVHPSPTLAADPSGGNGNFPPSKVVAKVVHWEYDKVNNVTDEPCPTVVVGVNSVSSHHYELHQMLPRVMHDTSGLFSTGDVTDRPCPTILVGPNSMNSNHYQVHQRAGDGTGLITRDPEAPDANLVRRRYHYGDDLVEARRLTLAELRALSGFPADFILTGSYAQRWERIGRAVPPVMMSHIAAAIRDGILTPLRDRGVI